MKRGLFVIMALVLVIVLSLALACAQPAPAPSPSPAPAPAPSPVPAPKLAPPASKPVELKLWSGWPKDMSMTTHPFVDWFIDRVNQRGKAVGLSVKYLGGPEVFPAFEGTQAVGKGLADIGFTTPIYHTGIVPEGEAWKLSRITPIEERKSGAFKFLDDAHRKKANVAIMYRVDISDFFHLWLNVKRDKPDLSGLRIRSTPAYDSFVKALGGTTVTTAGPEAYSAVERGVVDGYGFPPLEVQYRKMEEVTKFIWGPPFYTNPTGQFINVDSWNKLSEEQRNFLNTISTEIEQESGKVWKDAYNDAMKYFTEKAKTKLEWIKFSPADEKVFLDTAYEAGWKAIIEKVPEAKNLRDMMQKK